MLNLGSFSSRQRSHDVRGFSLVELMITIAVMVILMAAVAPSVGNWMVSARGRSAAESVLTGLQKTRMEAIRRNQTVTFWLVSSTDPTQLDASCAPSSDSASWVISRSNPAGQCSADPDTRPAGFYDWFSAGDTSKGILIAARDSSAAAASSVTFDALGQVVLTGNPITSIDFTADGTDARRLRLMISAAGGARLCDRDTSAPDPRAC